MFLFFLLFVMNKAINRVFDRETGKSKGYGFCEYETSALVDSAVDLLHGFEHRGASLYLRRPNHENKSSQNNNQNGGSSSNKKINESKKKKASSSKRKSVDEISRVVSSFSIGDKREILSQMKVLIEQNEKGAKEILLDNPQLAQALLLIQMEFNLVKVQDIHALTMQVTNQNVLKNDQSEEKHKDDNISLTAHENKVNEAKLKKLSNEQQSVLKNVMKMSKEEIEKLPESVQAKIRAVQAQLAKQSSIQ